MLRQALVAAALVLTSTSVRSQAFDGCYARDYDAAHMKDHAGQTVSSVKMKLEPRDMGDGLNISAQLRFKFRDDARDYYAVGSCKDQGGSLYCALDQDAGEIIAKPVDGGLSVSPINDLRVDGPDGGEEDNVTIEKSNPEDRVFMLSPASDCSEFDAD